jgi:hypothetical protein
MNGRDMSFTNVSCMVETEFYDLEVKGKWDTQWNKGVKCAKDTS